MTERYDIAVVGAGTSGIVAALAAARAGARVALVESSGRLGGTAIHGLHRYVCGLFRTGGAQADAPLHGPTTISFCRRLAGGDLETLAVRRGRVWLLPFAGGETLEACAEAAIADESRIRLFRGLRPMRTIGDSDRIAGIELDGGNVLQVDAAIDCTGSAEVCRMAGCEVAWPDSPALAGYGFEVRNVDENASGTFGLSVAIPLRLRREIDGGRLPPHLAYTTWEAGNEAGTGWIKLALPMSHALSAREEAEAVWNILKRESCFVRADIVRRLSAVLPRETAHLKGERLLTGADVLGARKFPDGVARNAWPIERWTENSGVSYRYLPDGECHDVPEGCLRPQNGPRNLLCAGAAISADSDAAAAIRVMGVCMALGEAAASVALRGAFSQRTN
mgnify:CR=1 FL=1